MLERILLGSSVTILVAGLTFWAANAEPGRELHAPIGQHFASDDHADHTTRLVLQEALFGQLPIRRVLVRSHTSVGGAIVGVNDAEEVWRRAAEGLAITRHFPVILGDAASVRAHAAAAATTTEDVTTLIERSEEFDIEQWLAARTESLPVEPGRVERSEPEKQRNYGIFAFRDKVAVAMFPVRDPSHVLAWLSFGNWRDCPPPEVHVAIARRWQLRYGARPIRVTADTIEFDVTQPPETEADAWALVREHVAYNPQLTMDGSRTLEEIAGELLTARRWTFTWRRAHFWRD